MSSSESESEQAEREDRQFIAELRAALSTATAAQAIETSSPPEQLLELIVRAAARAIPSPEGALFLVDIERQVLKFDVVIGSTAANVKDLEVAFGHGIAGLVAVSGQALAVANAQEDPRHARDIAEKSGYLPTTILAVPVVNQDGSTIGVLELLYRQGQPTSSLTDMELLGLFAQQVAIVLDFRRSQASVGALVGQTPATIGGVSPAMAIRITEQAARFAARVEADPISRRTAELAELMTTIARRGPDEYEACASVLEAFAGYLRARPAPGTGMEIFE